MTSEWATKHIITSPLYDVKDTFTSHIDKKIFLTFLLTPYLYTFSLYENPSFIIFSAETIAGFPVFRLLTYEFCLSLWKIARCSVILLLPLFWVTRRVSYKNYLSFWAHPWIFWLGPCCSSFLFFCIVSVFCFLFLFCFFWGGFFCSLFCFLLFFLRFVSFVLCCLYLWIVHSWFPPVYYLQSQNSSKQKPR